MQPIHLVSVDSQWGDIVSLVLAGEGGTLCHLSDCQFVKLLVWSWGGGGERSSGGWGSCLRMGGGGGG